MSDTNVTNNSDNSVALPRLATFGGIVSEKAEQTVETIQRKDLKFRILNALTAAVFAYPWILFFRAIKLMDMNRITWVDFLIMIIFLLTCFGFAANSRKTGRSFSGYLIYPYVLAILMPVLVYLGRLLPRVGSGLIREGLGGAVKSALRMNKGLFSQAGFFFIFFLVVSIVLAVVSLLELLSIRRLFYSLRREHYRIVRILEEATILKIVRFLGLINLLYLIVMIVYYYYYAISTPGYNHWITGIMTVVFAFVFFNMLANIYTVIKYDTYNVRTGPFLFIYGLTIALMQFTSVAGLPIIRTASGALQSMSILGFLYFIFLSTGIFCSLLGSYFTKA